MFVVHTYMSGKLGKEANLHFDVGKLPICDVVNVLSAPAFTTL